MIHFFVLVAREYIDDFFRLDVDPSDTVAVVKARIQDKTGEQGVFYELFFQKLEKNRRISLNNL